MVDLPEEEPKEVVEKKKSKAPKAGYSHVLRRRAAARPAVEERKKRQKRSRQHLKKSIMKPTSGHKSPRPGRHITKVKKHLESTHAK